MAQGKNRQSLGRALPVQTKKKGKHSYSIVSSTMGLFLPPTSFLARFTPQNKKNGFNARTLLHLLFFLPT